MNTSVRFSDQERQLSSIFSIIVRLHSSHDHRGGKLSKSLIISEKQISTRGIFRNSRQRRGGKRAKKKGGGTACPEENSKVLVTRVRRNGCRVAKLVPRITSCKSPFRAGTDRWLTRNFRVPYTHPPAPEFHPIRVSSETSGSQSTDTYVSRILHDKGSLRHTIFIQIRWFSFELRHLLEEWQLYDNFSFKFL